MPRFRAKIEYPEEIQEFFNELIAVAQVERTTTDGVFVIFEAEDDWDLRGQIEELANLHVFQGTEIPRPQQLGPTSTRDVAGMEEA